MVPLLARAWYVQDHSNGYPPSYLGWGFSRETVLVSPTKGQRTGCCCCLFLRPLLHRGGSESPEGVEFGAEQTFCLPSAGGPSAGFFLASCSSCREEAWG